MRNQPTINRVCEWCGVAFLARPSAVKFGKAKRCSTTCSYTARVISPEVRFWSKVNKDGPIPSYRPDLGPCWTWTAACGSYGYGEFNFNGRPVGAHRFAYISCIGPVPAGLHLDHLCRVPSCVNPAHLEPVTFQENLRRAPDRRLGVVQRSRTECPRGHAYDSENTRTSKGSRYCRRCDADRYLAKRALRGAS